MRFGVQLARSVALYTSGDSGTGLGLNDVYYWAMQ